MMDASPSYLLCVLRIPPAGNKGKVGVNPSPMDQVCATGSPDVAIAMAAKKAERSTPMLYAAPKPVTAV